MKKTGRKKKSKVKVVHQTYEYSLNRIQGINDISIVINPRARDRIQLIEEEQNDEENNQYQERTAKKTRQISKKKENSSQKKKIKSQQIQEEEELQQNQFVEKEQIKKQKAQISCKCRKSGCRKQYCQCFKAGVLCSQKCECIDCQNNVQLVQKKQLQKQKKSIIFCSCKTNKCEKNYCKCKLNQQLCTQLCECKDCHNRGQNQVNIINDQIYSVLDQKVEHQKILTGRKKHSEELPDEKNIRRNNFKKPIQKHELHKKYDLRNLESGK